MSQNYPVQKLFKAKNDIAYFAKAQAEIIYNFSEWHKLYDTDLVLAFIFMVRTAYKSVT